MEKYKNLVYTDLSTHNQFVISCTLDGTDISLVATIGLWKIVTKSSIADLNMEIGHQLTQDNMLFQVLDIINDELTSYYQMMSDFEFQDHDVF